MTANQLAHVTTAARATSAVVAVVGVPTTAFTASDYIRSHIRVAILMLCVYELIVLVIGMIATITAQARHAWETRLAERLDQAIQRSTSGYTKRYMQAMAADTRYFDSKGLKTGNEYNLELDDTFISLGLDRRASHRLQTAAVSPRNILDSSAVSIWQVLSASDVTTHPLAIIGPPGSGKTTLLRSVAHSFAVGKRQVGGAHVRAKIPILIALRDLKTWAANPEGRLADLLTAGLPALNEPLPPGWIERNLRRGRFAVLLDGLDEISDYTSRAKLATWLERQEAANQGNIIIISSRPFGYSSNPVAGTTILQVRPFDTRQIQSFIERWYLAVNIRSYGQSNRASRRDAALQSQELLGQLRRSSALMDLAANPLLLTMICNVHKYRGALPGSRAELYDEMCDVFLGRRHQARGIELRIGSSQLQLILEHLAYHYMTTGVSEMPTFDAVRVIDLLLDRVAPELRAAEVLTILENTAGLLVERERDIYAFAHLTFQEFLAARYISNHGLGGDLAEVVDEPWWRETVRLYCAIDDASDIVSACLLYEANSDTLALARLCEIEARQISPALRLDVDRRLSPIDVRENSANRAIVGKARLRLRFTDEHAIRDGTFASSTPITCIEYQAFLDAKQSTAPPEWWLSDVYPVGLDYAPVTGVRHADAQNFCEWLQEYFDSSLLCRLPTVEEVREGVDVLGRKFGDNSTPFWSVSASSATQHKRFFPVLRPGLDDAHWRPVYAGPISIASQTEQPAVELSRWVAADMARARGQTRGYDEPLEARDSATDRLVADSLISSYNAFCDGARLRLDIGIAAELARSYFAEYLTSSEHEQDILRLVESIERALRFTNVYEDRPLSSISVVERLATRDALLSLSTRFNSLLADLGGVKVALRLLADKRGQSSRKREVVLYVLARAYVEMYLDMCAFERQLIGKSTPTDWPHLAYVRASGAESRISLESLLRPGEHVRGFWPSVGKPVLDRVGALLVLMLSWPLLLISAAAIKLTSRGPVFYSASCIGKGGVVFRTVKLRSMYLNADERRDDFLELNERDGGGILFKIRKDPRITPVGRWLRRSGLDGLPRFLNVLLGSMSLVGPRTVFYADNDLTYLEGMSGLAVKPGMTGLWQISGRSDLSYDEAIRLELHYVENISFGLDVAILVRTVFTALARRGAY